LEMFQPYNAPKWPEPEMLGVLDDFAVFDKHRLIATGFRGGSIPNVPPGHVLVFPPQDEAYEFVFSLTLTPQPDKGVTYAGKISKNETRIDWSKSWKDVHDRIRGLSSFPGAWFEVDGVRIKVLRSTKGEGSGPAGTALDDKLTVACGAGAVRLMLVQRAGKQPMSADEFLRGTPVKPGARVA